MVWKAFDASMRKHAIHLFLICFSFIVDGGVEDVGNLSSRSDNNQIEKQGDKFDVINMQFLIVC